MPTLAQHQSRNFTKILLIGDSKSGKTGALTSLVKAGYKLGILDYDNGLDVLSTYVNRECPKQIDNVNFVTLRDEFTIDPAGIRNQKPQAYVRGLKLLDHWKHEGVDLGEPYQWGPDHILVLDSLTFMSDACFDWRMSLAPVGKAYDIRAVYKDAQDSIENVLALLTGGNFCTNVIITSHAKYMERETGVLKGYPVSVGSALSPTIPRYFNNYFLFETKGGKRRIVSKTTNMFDLANAKPFDMKDEYEIGDGLAKIFEALRK